MHFILEYSDNIDKEELRLQELFAKLHETAVGTGLFPLKGMRSRAYPTYDYRLADGNPNHMFAHLSAMVGRGRTMEEREPAAKAFFAVLTEHFADSYAKRGVALSFEMRELEEVLKYNKNNFGDHIE